MRKYRLIALFICICLVLAACSDSAEKNSTRDSSTEASSSGANAEDSAVSPDSIALYIGDEPIYYYEFNFQVVTQINTYAASEEGLESGFDSSQSLSEQYYDSETTYEQKFTDDTITELHNTISMYLEAMANGYEMGDGEKEYIDNYFDSLNTYIEDEGLTIEEALFNKYGIKMTREQVNSILERNLIGKAYETLLREEMDFTDQEIETFYEEHKTEIILPDCNVVSLRIINFSTEQMAMDVLEKFENGDRSEESFIELLKLYSNDEETIKSEGLYTDLSPTSTDVSLFDEVEAWVFDKTREPGDYTILSQSSGYALVYFVEKGDPFWMVWGRYAKENYDIQSIIDKYPVSYPEGLEE